MCLMMAKVLQTESRDCTSIMNSQIKITKTLKGEKFPVLNKVKEQKVPVTHLALGFLQQKSKKKN